MLPTCALVLALLPTSHVFAAKSIVVNRVDCIDQPYHYTQYVRCGFRTLRNQSQQLIGELILAEPVHQLHGTFNVYTKYQKSRNLLYGTTVNLCPLLESSKPSAAMITASTSGLDSTSMLITAMLMEKINSNFPQLVHPCPYEGTVNLTGAQVQLGMVPQYVVPGQYVIDMRLFDEQNRTVVNARVMFTLLSGGLLDGIISS